MNVVTVNDLLILSSEIQDFDVRIFKFGGTELLEKKHSSSNRFMYKNNKVCAFKFGGDSPNKWMDIILDINEV